MSVVGLCSVAAKHKSVTITHPDALGSTGSSALDPCTYDLHGETSVADVIKRVKQDWKAIHDIALEYNGLKMYGDEKLQDISSSASIVFRTVKWSLATLHALKEGRASINVSQSITNAVRIVKEAAAIMQVQEFNSKAQFLNMAESVSNMSARKNPVIAIVGPTGAGKSTMIEALLDIRGVIPSNCYRACTAVPTFISYNENEALPFKVTIHYTTGEAFLRDIKQSVRDILDQAGDDSSEAATSNDIINAAWSRLHVMFPHLEVEDLQHFDPGKALDRYTGFGDLLNSSAELESDSMEGFIKKTSCHLEPEYTYYLHGKSYTGHAWPLIKRIDLKVRSAALETGVTLIDLPGVGDTNSDRGNVWQKYIQACTAVWVVTPITRAGQAREAHKLLSESFRRQLQLDGTVLSVGFVCTNTDVLDAAPSWKQLGLDQKYGEYRNYVRGRDEPWIQKKELLRELKAARKKTEVATRKANAELTTLTKQTLKKRKAHMMDDEADGAPDFQCPELTEVEQRLAEYQKQEEELEVEISELERVLKEHDLNCGTGAEEAFLLCMRTRNAKQKTQLKLDFRETLRNLHGEENLDQIVQRIPVFTVSATEYQRISHEETGGKGVRQLSDTEIPQLRQYCHDLPDTMSSDWQKRMCSNLNVFFDAAIPWALRVANVSELTEEQKEVELLRVRRDIDKYIKMMQKEATDTLKKGQKQSQALTSLFSSQAQIAVQKLPKLVGEWSERLCYATYAAIVRHGGIFAGRNGAYDWVEEIVALMWHEGTDQQWYNCWNFETGAIHQTIDSLRSRLIELFEMFESEYNKSAETRGVNLAYHRRLRNIIERHKDNIISKVHECEEYLQQEQKRANRAFSETVPEEVEGIFDWATRKVKKGRGVYKRLRSFLAGAFDSKKNHIFGPGIRKATRILKGGFAAVDNNLVRAMEKMQTDMDVDMSGLFSEESQSVIAKERKVRDQVLQKLRRECCILDEKALLRDIQATTESQIKEEMQVFPGIKEEIMSDVDDGYGEVKSGAGGEDDDDDDDDGAEDAYLQASQMFAEPAEGNERASVEPEEWRT